LPVVQFRLENDTLCYRNILSPLLEMVCSQITLILYSLER